MKAYTKDIFRTIKKGKKRFFAIMLITALGVCMLSALKASCEDLRYTADAFFDKQNLFDISVVSTLGLTEEDIEILARLEGVEAAEGAYSETVFTTVEEKTKQASVCVLSKAGINEPYLLEGEMPKAADEILVTSKYISETGKQIGDLLEIEEDMDDEAVSDSANETEEQTTSEDENTENENAEETDSEESSLDEDLEIEVEEEVETPNFLHTSYTIVGVVIDVTDINSNEGAVAFRSNSTTDYTFFVMPEAVSSDIYTAVYLTLEDTDEMLCYSDEYEAAVEEIVSFLEDNIKEDREQARYTAVTDEALEKIADAQKKMDDAFADADEEIADAKKEIADGWQEVADGEKEIADAKIEIADGEIEIADVKIEIADGEAEIADGWGKIADGEAELANAKAELADAAAEIADGWEEIEKAKTEIADGWKEIEAGEAEIEAGEAELEENKKKLEESENNIKTQFIDEKEKLQGTIAQLEGLPGQEEYLAQAEAGLKELEEAEENALKQLEESKIELNTGKSTLEKSRQELEAGKIELEKAEEQLKEAEEQLKDGEKQLEEGKKKIADAEQEIKDGKAELLDAEQELADGKAELIDAEQELADGKIELSDAELELEDGRKELEDGQKELDENLVTYEEKKAEAEEKLADAKAEVADIKMTDWYISTRTSLSGYGNIKTDAACIEAIGNAFPVLFLTIAILISLTTISRMVEEDRGLIGTYKALGFTDKEIRRKYAIYALLACIFGGILGDVMGFVVLPNIVFIIFGVMYQLPTYQLTFNTLYGIGGIILFILGIVGSSIVSCSAELSHMPAALMRPKAPRSGSRVLLERVTFIWRRLSFLNKVTVRNLFRYKKRFFMTIFGIAGCTALLICGYTIKDTVTELMPLQYEDTCEYDVMAVAEDNDKLLEYLEEEEDITEYINTLITNVKVINSFGKEETIQLIVVPDNTALEKYIRLYDEEGNAVKLGKDDVLITINASKVLEFETGDTVTLQTLQLDMADVHVSGIVMNYLGNNVYTTQSKYEQLFEEMEANGALILLDGTSEEQLSFADSLAEKDGMLSAVGTDSLKEEFEPAFQIINMVVYIIIILAAALAFVVLFALATTNISERERELATIKVLGFYDNEVHLYVNKETVILTAIGILLGFPFGKVLGEWIMAILNLPSIYFKTSLYPISYGISAVIAISFAFIVNFITDRSLDKINPVEALKSIE